MRAPDVTVEAWELDYRGARPWGEGRWRLACPGCGADVSGRSSWRPLFRRRPHFSHRRESSPCSWAKESDLHRRVKAAILAAARTAGWCGDCEVPGPGYRADVLVEHALAARGPDGVIGRPNVVYTADPGPGPPRRVAFEVQVTEQGPAETMDRTETYHRAGVEVVWLLTWDKVHVADHPSAVGLKGGEPLAVTMPRAYGAVSAIPLDAFVHDVLADGLQRALGPAGYTWMRGPVRPDAHPVSIPPPPSPLPEPAGTVRATPTPAVAAPPVLRREQAVRPSLWRRLLDLLLGRPE